MNKNVVLGIIAVAALGAAVFIYIQNAGSEANPAEGLGQQQAWVCADCHAEIRMTKQEYIDLAAARNVHCPSCQGANWTPAVICTNPECGKAIATVGHGRPPSTCPHCGHRLGDWRDYDEGTADYTDVSTPAPTGGEPTGG
ncbi:MAG: hypothetical protein KDA05_00670 [Phycisphaerales bacterium]|nr:hypothetical protein [Phycisphaerales bacterium]